MNYDYELRRTKAILEQFNPWLPQEEDESGGEVQVVAISVLMPQHAASRAGCIHQLLLAVTAPMMHQFVCSNALPANQLHQQWQSSFRCHCFPDKRWHLNIHTAWSWASAHHSFDMHSVDLHNRIVPCWAGTDYYSYWNFCDGHRCYMFFFVGREERQLSFVNHRLRCAFSCPARCADVEMSKHDVEAKT